MPVQPVGLLDTVRLLILGKKLTLCRLWSSYAYFLIEIAFAFIFLKKFLHPVCL